MKRMYICENLEHPDPGNEFYFKLTGLRFQVTNIN